MVYGYIYKIENLVNGKLYIGLTTRTNPNKRRSQHFHKLRYNIHPNGYLQNAFNKYGENAFEFKCIDHALDKKSLDKLEKIYIEKYNSMNRIYGYNLKDGGFHAKHSPETCKKIGNVHRGKYVSKESRNKMSKSHTGKKLSEKTRLKLSNVKKGIPKSLNYRKGMGIRQRKNGLFGFTGLVLNKRIPSEGNPWNSRINYNGHQKSLGYFPDPLTCEIVHDIVFEEIYS